MGNCFWANKSKTHERVKSTADTVVVIPDPNLNNASFANILTSQSTAADAITSPATAIASTTLMGHILASNEKFMIVNTLTNREVLLQIFASDQDPSNISIVKNTITLSSGESYSNTVSGDHLCLTYVTQHTPGRKTIFLDCHSSFTIVPESKSAEGASSPLPKASSSGHQISPVDTVSIEFVNQSNTVLRIESKGADNSWPLLCILPPKTQITAQCHMNEQIAVFNDQVQVKSHLISRSEKIVL